MKSHFTSKLTSDLPKSQITSPHYSKGQHQLLKYKLDAVQEHTHVLYELRIGQHKKVIEDIMKATVCGFCFTNQPIDLLFDFMSPGNGLL